jgi:tRNA A37 threonylcarbamoyladenosine synthetase subunit TsaC/SUA5/YrdC
LLATTLIPPGQTEALNDAEEIREKYEKVLAAVMDAGACSLEPTTVVDLTPMDLGGEPLLVRKGRSELHLLNL